ncbi:MAG: DUF2490 domain-containing protein [Sediminibacterium sp.]
MDHPALIKEMTAEEIAQFHWLKTELIGFCSDHSITQSGSREKLSRRITYYLRRGQLLLTKNIQIKDNSGFNWEIPLLIFFQIVYLCRRNKNWRCIFIFFLVLSPMTLFAQIQGTGSWNVLNFKYTHSPQLSFFGETQLRSLSFYNQFHYYEFKGGVNYKIFPNVKISLGAGSYQTFREGGNFLKPKNNDEFRLWPQLTLFQDIRKLKVEQRFRSELRWTSTGYRNRFRYRLAISHPFGTKENGAQPFLATISNELFFTNREPYFERNRLQANINYKIAPATTLQVGYLHQFDYRINDEIGRDFLILGLYFEFNRKKNKLPKANTELNDF